MKRALFIVMIVLAVIAAFLLGRTPAADAGSKDKMCVMHKEGQSFVEKWVEPPSLAGHFKHGDHPCYQLTPTADPPTPVPDPLYKLYFPYIGGGPMCWECIFDKSK